MATKSATTLTMNPARTQTPPTEGQIAHTEFITNDPKALRTFLEKTFNWKFETFPSEDGPEYHMFSTPGGSAGGVSAPPQPGVPVATTNYIACNDIRATAKKVEKNGAKITVPPTEIPNMGWFFQFQVKGGPVLACWQAPPTNGNR